MQVKMDLHNNVKQVLAVAPVALGATGAITGRTIDTKGYNGAEFILEYGAVTTTGTVATVILYEGDTTGAFASVADTDLIGTETLASLLAGARASGTGMLVSKRLGYKGNKRYLRLNIVGSGTTSVGIVAASALLFNPEAAPISNP